jgi:exonuclease SbcD
MAKILGEFARALAPHPIRVLMAHLHVDKSELGGGERELHLGQTYAVNAGSLPAGLHYLALGHIHRPQEIAGPSPTRFAGSPLALDFSEGPQQKSVVLVDIIGPAEPARLRLIPLSAGRRLRDVHGSLDELTLQVNDFGDDYLRVFLRVESSVPGAAEEVRRLFPNAIQVRIEATGEVDTDRPARDRLTPGLDRMELFSRYQRAKYKTEPDPQLLALFRELLAEAAAAGGD